MKFKSRIVVFFTGFVICMIVLEVSLRIVGAIYSYRAESSGERSSAEQSTLLCLGDSVTFGLGAARGFAYPEQLQVMLDAADDTKGKYNVINRGWPGQNSAQLLLRLEKYLQEFHPDIVTILSGARNQDNFFGFREYLEKTETGNQNFFLKVHESLDTFRTYKFFRLLFRNDQQTPKPQLPEIDPGKYPSEVKQEFEKQLYEEGKTRVENCNRGEIYKEQGEYDKALSFSLQAIDREEVTGTCYNLVASIYREQKQYDEAARWYKKGIEHDPTEFLNYDGIGQLYRDRNQLQEALNWFKKGFARARYTSLYGHCYVGVSGVFREMGDTQGAIAFFAAEKQNKQSVDEYLYTLASDYLLMFQNNRSAVEIHRWIEADITQIIALCEQYNARVILQNYPYEPEIAFIYRDIAGRQHLPLVDQQTAFAGFTKNGVLSPDYFVPDKHPNARGYHLMAENLWKVVTGNDLQAEE